jgi:hypothetical protein
MEISKRLRRGYKPRLASELFTNGLTLNHNHNAGRGLQPHRNV